VFNPWNNNTPLHYTQNTVPTHTEHRPAQQVILYRLQNWHLLKNHTKCKTARFGRICRFLMSQQVGLIVTTRL